MRNAEFGIAGLVIRAEALRSVLMAVESFDPDDAYEILSEALRQVRRVGGIDPYSPLRLAEPEPATAPRGVVPELPPASPSPVLEEPPVRALRKDFGKERKKRKDPKKPTSPRGKLRPAEESSSYIATAPRYGPRVTKILELVKKKPLRRAEIDQALRVTEDKMERHRVSVQLSQMKRDGLLIQDGKGMPYRLAG